MGFMVQPKKEGVTNICPNCDTELIGRLSNYKGRFPDKLQWQSKSERKAHYDKNGNCKDAEGTTSTQSTSNESSKPGYGPEISKTNSQDEDIRYIKNKIDLMFAMISEQFRDYTDRKNHS